MSDLRCLCYSLTSDPPFGIYSHETVDTAQTRHKALRAPTNRLSGSFFHHAVGALYMGVGKVAVRAFVGATRTRSRNII